MNCDRGGGPPVIIANLYSFQAIALFELDERPHYVCFANTSLEKGIKDLTTIHIQDAVEQVIALFCRFGGTTQSTHT